MALEMCSGRIREVALPQVAPTPMGHRIRWFSENPRTQPIRGPKTHNKSGVAQNRYNPDISRSQMRERGGDAATAVQEADATAAAATNQRQRLWDGAILHVCQTCRKDESR
jgi:hypothetical protein